MPSDFDLGGVICPWGRNVEEYEAFFRLSEVSPSARILDCGGGPSSFAADWGKRGRFVVAADPVYRCAGIEIASGFESTAKRMLEGMERARHRFKWDYYGSPEKVVTRRRNALTTFVADFEDSSRPGRYVSAQLPELPFPSDSFDLVLCSHLLFLYSNELDIQMHVDSLKEMLRVAPEVRIFPLLDMDGQPSVHVNPSVAAVSTSAQAEVIAVPFEFQRGGSNMLRLTRPA